MRRGWKVLSCIGAHTHYAYSLCIHTMHILESYPTCGVAPCVLSFRLGMLPPKKAKGWSTEWRHKVNRVKGGEMGPMVDSDSELYGCPVTCVCVLVSDIF